MDNSNAWQNPPLFRGRIVKATYLEQKILDYQGNPLIEALPPIWSKGEVIELLQHYPDYQEAYRAWATELRLHLIRRVLKIFAVLPRHIDLEQRISCTIRTGYEARNPCAPDAWHNIQDKIEALRSELSPQKEAGAEELLATIPFQEDPEMAATGFAFVGISGIGKTTSLKKIFARYPQVILHSLYRGEDFNHVQVVWIKLECPFDGSIKGLCLNFFQALDSLLGTHYYENYGRKGRATVDEMLPKMARVSLLHSIGVLVIDEIQHLSEAKSGGARKMLNFLVQLVNTVGMPVIPVGTYKAIPILGSEFRQARRSAGQGDLFWYAMQEDDTWQLFLESLWMYQYTKTPCPLTPELSHALYDVTQGITDLAVKVYMLAQVRAITRGDDEGIEENITEALIRSVAFDSLRLANPILEALRSGNFLDLQKVDDVLPIDIEPFIQEALKNCSTQSEPGQGATPGETRQEEAKTAEQQPKTAPGNTSRQKRGSASPTAAKAEGSQRNTGDTPAQPQGDLLDAVSREIKKNGAAYDALLKAGYFKPTGEELTKEDVR
jgi:AAA domain